MPVSTRAEPGRALAPADLLPHDLLEIASPDALVWETRPPPWAEASLRRAPFVVVRRAPCRGLLVPVGVRGPARGHRLAAWLPAPRALARVRPEDLALRRGWLGREGPPFAALSDVEAVMAAHGARWGPAGSVGFELATGTPCVGEASDLDLVVRAPDPLSRASARRLHGALAALPVRADVQLETPRGAVALAEWAAGGRSVVLRTAWGPRSVEAPWGAADAAP